MLGYAVFFFFMMRGPPRSTVFPYTALVPAKGAAGLIDLARKGAFYGERIVFLHTGGAAALGGYDFAFDFSRNWVTL